VLIACAFRKCCKCSEVVKQNLIHMLTTYLVNLDQRCQRVFFLFATNVVNEYGHLPHCENRAISY